MSAATPKPCPTPGCIARHCSDWPPEADHAELMDNRVLVKFFHPPRHSGGESRYWVICQTCGLRTPEISDRAEVVALWNRLEFVPEWRHGEDYRAEPMGAILNALASGRRLELYLDNDEARVTDVTDEPPADDLSPEGEKAYIEWQDGAQSWDLQYPRGAAELFARALGLSVRHA